MWNSMQYRYSSLNCELKKNCNSHHCAPVFYSLLMFTITKLDTLPQKYLVEKKRWEWSGKWQKLLGMLPGLLMNPGGPFKESSFPQHNDIVFYMYSLIKPETIVLYIHWMKMRKGFNFGERAKQLYEKWNSFLNKLFSYKTNNYI